MKIYFKLSNYEKHKFINNETIYLLDFMKLWFASKTRYSDNKTYKNIIMTNVQTGLPKMTNAYKIRFLIISSRINMFNLSKSWFMHKYEVINYEPLI